MQKLPGCAIALFAGLILAGGTTDARADIIIDTTQGSIQPDENLLFNEPGLLDSGTTVQGITNNTGHIFDISSDIDLLTPSGGQAKVVAADSNDVFDLFFLRPHDSTLLFGEFEASISIVDAQAGGTATVTACNQNGSFGATAPFTPSGPTQDGGPCEALTFDLTTGNNFFVISVADVQALRGVHLTTSTGILDVSQIRVGNFSTFNGEDLTPVATPEPASLVLLGTGLLAGARSIRNRRASKTV